MIFFVFVFISTLCFVLAFFLFSYRVLSWAGWKRGGRLLPVYWQKDQKTAALHSREHWMSANGEKKEAKKQEIRNKANTNRAILTPTMIVI